MWEVNDIEVHPDIYIFRPYLKSTPISVHPCPVGTEKEMGSPMDAASTLIAAYSVIWLAPAGRQGCHHHTSFYVLAEQ